jgi:trehalose-phosphatase
VTGLSSLRALLPSALVALDFDGTLAPISPHPDDARPVAGVRPLLCDIAAAGATLAIVTGRSVDTLLRISGLEAVPGLIVYGLHGVGDVPALREVNAWSARSGRPRLTVAVTASVTASGTGPLDGLTDLTLPGPPAVVALLRQVVG